MPNEYLREMDSVPDLTAFAAVVYSSNWESEIRDDALIASAAGVGAATTPGEDGVGRPQGSSAEESVLVLDPSQGTFDSAWQRAMGQK